MTEVSNCLHAADCAPLRLRPPQKCSCMYAPLSLTRASSPTRAAQRPRVPSLPGCRPPPRAASPPRSASRYPRGRCLAATAWGGPPCACKIALCVHVCAGVGMPKTRVSFNRRDCFTQKTHDHTQHTTHAPVARHNILQRHKHRVAHVQLAGDVGRRHGDGIGRLGGRQIRRKVTVGLPEGVEAGLPFFRVEVFGEVGGGARRGGGGRTVGGGRRGGCGCVRTRVRMDAVCITRCFAACEFIASLVKLHASRHTAQQGAV